MSYDFELYTRFAVSLGKPPETCSGIVNCDGPDRVEDQDIPSELLPFLGKNRCLYRIHVEGEVGPENRSLIDQWLRVVIAVSKGVLIDLQTGIYETATKRGTVALGKSDPTSFGSMSFYFEDGEAFYERGFAAMFKTVAEHLPAAMPTRYGYYEPLQGKVCQGEYAEIVSAFQSETDLFLKAPAPFGHIFLSVPCKKTFERWHQRHFIRGCLHTSARHCDYATSVKFASSIRPCTSQIHASETFRRRSWSRFMRRGPLGPSIGSLYHPAFG